MQVQRRSNAHVTTACTSARFDADASTVTTFDTHSAMFDADLDTFRLHHFVRRSSLSKKRIEQTSRGWRAFVDTDECLISIVSKVFSTGRKFKNDKRMLQITNDSSFMWTIRSFEMWPDTDFHK
jgi:hypothetical protein